MLKIGDLVEHMFDGEWAYGIVIEINKDNSNMARVRWLNGLERCHLQRHLTLIGEA